jgi:hypothetical protein
MSSASATTGATSAAQASRRSPIRSEGTIASREPGSSDRDSTLAPPSGLLTNRRLGHDRQRICNARGVVSVLQLCATVCAARIAAAGGFLTMRNCETRVHRARGRRHSSPADHLRAGPAAAAGGRRSSARGRTGRTTGAARRRAAAGTGRARRRSSSPVSARADGGQSRGLAGAGRPLRDARAAGDTSRTPAGTHLARVLEHGCGQRPAGRSTPARPDRAGSLDTKRARPADRRETSRT